MKEKPKGSFRMYLLSSAALILAVFFCLYVTIQTLTMGYVNLFGYSVFRVVTGSMEPTIPVGAILLSQQADIDGIERGDIICFKSREASHFGYIVTHRVVSVIEDANGKRYLESRGDANLTSDPYYVQAENLIGKVLWYSDGKGVFSQMLGFISSKYGFVALIAIPILLIGGLILYSSGRNISGELDKAIDKLAKKKKKDPLDEKLPGFQFLTKRDYDEIYTSLKDELVKELNERKGILQKKED